jgi:heat shock protein HspQ
VLKDSRIQIGDRVRDKITKLEGIVVAVGFYATGSAEARIQQEGLKDSQPIEPIHIEFPQLDVIEKQVLATPEFKELEFAFGDKVKDTVSGFTGTVHLIFYWLHGCVRYFCLRGGLLDDGQYQVGESFDGMYLELVEARKELEPAAKTGGPSVNVKPHSRK